MSEFIFNIDGLGLIAAHGQTRTEIVEGKSTIVEYGASRFEVVAKSTRKFDVLAATLLGSRIARLHTPDPNPTGKKMFDKLLQELEPYLLTKSEILPSQTQGLGRARA